MKKKFIITITIISSVLITSLIYAVSLNPDIYQGLKQDNLDDEAKITESIDNLEVEIKKVRELYEEQSTKLSVQEQELIELQQQAYRQSELISQTENAIEEKQVQIDLKQEEVKKAQVEIDVQIKILRKRLRTMYKFGKTGYLQIVLKSDSIVNAMTRLDRIRLLTEYDKELLSNLKIAKDKLVIAKNNLVEEQKKLQNLKEEQIVQKEELEKTYDQVLVKKRQTLSNIEALQRQKEQLEKEQSFLDERLKRMVSQRAYVGGAMGWPLDLGYNYITSYFGPRRAPIEGASTDHGAIDIAVPTGENIYSALDGIVIVSEYSYGYGNYVVVDHGGGITTLYAHASQRYVSAGDSVSQGEPIAAAGSTGYSTGPHLHFEIRINGVRVDPLDYVVVP